MSITKEETSKHIIDCYAVNNDKKKKKTSSEKDKTNDPGKIFNTPEQPTEDSSINNLEMLCKLRTDPVIKKINSCDSSQINDYAKKVIRDFLIFIKNHTSTLSGDDLRLHYIVIIKILDRLFDKITKQNSEEIIMQSTKIIVVSPCFLKDENFFFC